MDEKKKKYWGNNQIRRGEYETMADHFLGIVTRGHMQVKGFSPIFLLGSSVVLPGKF